MKVLTVSDLVSPILYPRFQQGRFPNVDLIISCGDLPPEYLTSLVSVFDAPMYYVRGNHDLRYRDKPPSGGINLHGNILYLERTEFEDKTGISPRIELTEIGQYKYLIKQIESHRIFICKTRSPRHLPLIKLRKTGITPSIVPWSPLLKKRG